MANRRDFLLLGVGSTWLASMNGATAVTPQIDRVVDSTDRVRGTVWQVLNVGAGGQLTGIDIAPDGTKVVKSDVGGAYIWKPALGRWSQLLTARTMPRLDVDSRNLSGVWEICIAPSLTSRLFMIARSGYLYRSDNCGDTWARTSLPNIVGADPNGKYKFANQKMAVDPGNPDHLIVGTLSQGVWRSTDAGSTWKRITEIPIASAEPGNAGIAFGPSTIGTEANSKTIYVPSFGNGVWLSIDGGETWKSISIAGDVGPVGVWTAQVSADGTYFCSDHTKVWKFQSGSWTSIADYAASTVCADPNRAGRLIISGPSGGKSGRQTLDYGKSWVGNSTWFPAYPKPGQRQIAKDILWLETSDTSYMTIGDMKIDKTDGYVYFAEGIGVWKADWPTSFRSFDWISQSSGIEELVANDIVCPFGGKAVVGVWDRGFFRCEDPKVFPSKYGTVNGAFVAGWAIDYASSDPSFLAGICNWNATQKSGFSTDGGRTWSTFEGLPARPQMGGAIAVASPDNMVWLPANNGVPYYTKDRGVNWIACSSLPRDGWIFAYYLNSHPVAADRKNIGTFYLHNAVRGLYRSVDSGETWKLVSGRIEPYAGFNNRLRATPGIPGDLWWTSGPVGAPVHPVESPLRHSADYGVTWRDVPNVLEVYDFGFGAPKISEGYPAIFIAGWVNKTWGYWRSDDKAATWVHVGTFPNDNFDAPKAISGDMNAHGKIYVGFTGTGFAVGQLES